VPIFCFEPSTEAFKPFVRNVQIEKLPKTFAIPGAIAESAGLLKFFEAKGYLESSRNKKVRLKRSGLRWALHSVGCMTLG
jgi:hypothetical protein